MKTFTIPTTTRLPQSERRLELVLLTGPPYSGKTMVASRVAALLNKHFRAPHHTVSSIGLRCECGSAAGGVLFLDEITEFRTTAIENLAVQWSSMHPDVRPLILGSVQLFPDLEKPPFSEPYQLHNVVKFFSHICSRYPVNVRTVAFEKRDTTKVQSNMWAWEMAANILGGTIKGDDK